MSYSVEAVSTKEGLLELKRDWDCLLERCESSNVFVSYEWAWAWSHYVASDAALAARHRLHILVLRQEGRVVAIAPLMERLASRGPIRIRKIEFVGGYLGDYHDFVLDGDTAEQLETILSHFAARQEDWDLIDLRDIPPDSIVPRALEQALANSRLHFRVQPDTPCPYLPIRTDWEGFLQTRSRSTRQTFRNQANRLRQLEAAGLRIRVIEDPQEEPGLVEKMAALERRKKAQGGPTVYVLAHASEFFESLLQSLGPKGRVYVAVMEKSGQLIAHELGFRCGEKLWCYEKAFDPSYARYSPGNMLMAAMLDFGHRKGYKEYDFLGGAEAYKFRWTDSFRQNVHLAMWNSSWRSRIAALLYLDVKPRLDRWASE